LLFVICYLLQYVTYFNSNAVCKVENSIVSSLVLYKMLIAH